MVALSHQTPSTPLFSDKHLVHDKRDEYAKNYD